ncbi:hypothetical protein Tco_1113416 [Tanacetum coccineum]|uniref:Uncharacterized protein n=1 Tax=Tanacetum coccineum TaxID=301880 RepID=A0ABQ5IV47_9ASTR
MESSSSNSEKRELQLMQLEERQFHSKCVAWFKELNLHLETLHNNKRNLLMYLDALDKLIDERVLKYGELRMKDREVQAIKEIEKRLKEREIQQQESLSTNGTTLIASLVTKGATVGNSELLLLVLLYHCWFKIDTATKD